MPSRDYEELLASLNEHGVRYLVVGAHAVAFHARPRATQGLDLFIEPTENWLSSSHSRSELMVKRSSTDAREGVVGDVLGEARAR